MSLPSQATIQSWWAPRCTGPWLTITLHGEGRVTVRPAIGDAVMALNACLRAWNYRTRRADTGAYNCRLKVGGSGWSMHAFATAPDINWSTNPYGPRLVTDMPAAMTRAITQIRTMSGAQVWQWGGYWRGNKDAMHFEIVCSPAAIRTGIDPRTVPGHAFDPLPTPLPPKPQTEDIMATKEELEEIVRRVVSEEHAASRSWIRDELKRSVQALTSEVRARVAGEHVGTRTWIREELKRTTIALTREIRDAATRAKGET